MTTDPQALYTAFQTKDTRFDGRFFVGVSSTGIYCRPVCHAKMPKPENCTFYATAAEAEQAGYRPCLLCRPELAPGTSAVDASASLARRAARLLEERCGNAEGLDLLAARLGCTDRHLRRVFQTEYHVTPVQYLQTCRLLLAKSLLTDTGLPVLEVAMAAGFGSLRRFNDVFQARYRLSPTALRKQATGAARQGDGITVSLGYRPPYLWDQMLQFLSYRAVLGVEVVHDGEYARMCRVEVDGVSTPLLGWIRVRQDAGRNALSVTIQDTLLPALPQVLCRIRHLFDLHCHPDAVHEGLASMSAVAPGLPTLGTRVPGCFDPFEMSVRAVLGQQITVKAASTLAGRIAEAYGTPVEGCAPGLTHAFPPPERFLALPEPISNQLGPLGVTSARAKTILALARAFAEGSIDFGPTAAPEQEMRKLLALPGIGPWTAHYIAMRAMGWPDAFLETDYGVKKALMPRTPKEMLAMAEAWRPWRSYATVNLWNSL